MADDIEIKAHLTAEDDASPVIKALLRNLRRLDKLGEKLTAKPAIAAGLNRKADKALAAHRTIIAGQRAASRSQAVAAGRAEKAADAGLKRRIAFGQAMQRQKAAEERQSDAMAMRELRARLTFSSRMQTQKQAEARREERRREVAERRAAALTGRQFRDRLAFADRMNRQRLREERAAAAEGRRQQAATHRAERQHQASLAKLDRQSRQRRRELIRTGARTYDGASEAARSASVAGLAVGAGAAVAARRSIGVELANDDAMRNLQAYAGMDYAAVKRLRSEWAEGTAVALGSTVSDLLNAYSDAIKAGIPNSGAKDFTALAQKAAEAWQIEVQSVTDTLATVSTILTANGSAFDPKRLASVVNTTQALAAQMATTPEKMIEFQRQAAGSAQLLGMSQEAMLAIGAASTSLGNRPGESASMMDALASKLINVPALAKRQGIEGDQARALVRSLGYGSAEALDRDRRANPDEFMFRMLDKLSKLDGKKRDAAIRTLGGTEWLGELSRLVVGNAKVKEARKIASDPASQNAVDDVWAIHGKKLSFALKQLRASLSNVIGGFGEVLSPFVRDLAVSLTRWMGASADALKINLWAGLRGLAEGLAGPGKALRDLFGGKLVANPKAFYDFAKGFADGIRTIWETVSTILTGVGKAIGVDATNPEGLGKVIGLAIGGAVAAKLVPGDAIGGAAKGIGGIAGIVGGLAGGAAGAAAGAGALPVALAAVAAGVVASVSVSNWGALIAGLGKLVTGTANGDFGTMADGAKEAYGSTWKFNPLSFSQSYGEWIARKLFGDNAFGIVPKVDNPTAPDGAAGTLRKEMRHLGDTIGESTAVHKASLQRAGLYQHLVQPASFGGSARIGGGFTGSTPSPRSITGQNAASLYTATPGAALPAFGIGRSGSIIGRGIGGKGMLDAIAQAEGTAGRGDYEAVLGYGRYGKPSKPITSMNLNEAFAFGRQIKSKHGSSSAIGRYQIVGNTMMDAARALGMDPATTKFDASTQDRMAGWIAQRQGLTAWEGFKRNPAALAAAQSSMSGGGAPGSAADGVDRASSMLGMAENGQGRGTLNAFMRSAGYDIDAARTAWCSAFVNSSLASVGIQGTGSKVATSFLKWGEKIDPAAVMKGDVLVEARGRAAGQTGGHVGMATGATRIGPNGERQVEMLSGNSGPAGQGAVRKTWEAASSLSVRRAISSVPPTAQAATAGVPMPPAAIPGTGAGSGGAGSGSTVIHYAPVIHGGNMSPASIASAVEQRLADRKNAFAHDVEIG